MGRFNFTRNDEPENTGYSNNANESYDSGSASSYEEHLAELWRLIIFCIVGWAVAVVGFCILGTTADSLGILFVLAGVIIVDIPAFKILLAGGSLGGLLGGIVGAERIIKYTDGSEERDNSAWSAGLFVTIMTWLATLFVGLISIVVRIFRNFAACLRIRREEGIETDIKRAPWLPVVVGLAVFVLGAVISGIVGEAYGVIENNRDELDDQTTARMVADMVEGMESESYEYFVWAGAEKAATVAHLGNLGYQITVQSAGVDYLGLSEGIYSYAYLDGYWSSSGSPVSDAETIDKLEAYTIKRLINYDYIIGEGIASITAVKYGEADNDGEANSNYRFVVHSQNLAGDEEYIFEGGMSNGDWVVRRVLGAYSTPESISIDFNFK